MTIAETPDPNVTPFRSDLAADFLKGEVEADRFVEGVRHQAVRGIVPLRASPDESAFQTSELLYGEIFTVFEERDGWAWGQGESDGYVGYAQSYGLTAEPGEPTHQVGALRAFLYPEPHFKTPPLKALSLGARVRVVERAKGYSRVAPEGWIPDVALTALDVRAEDHVATAMRFLGVPYLWGGRSSLGIDCSGLIQVALAQAGIAAPRDTYLQVDSVGELVGRTGDVAMKRGDIVFFPGHVGFMVDGETLIHANVAAMAVSLDPVERVAARTLAQDGAGVTAVRRLVR
ncbi:NlpC/P60 family protein [Inquilinus sp. CAU 1745]|uniref:C40 family peptidase n=1 Tax=Inquilinus sp. CAU 1745 TaxID=3140369 RepID=UPI00325BFFF1